MQYVLFWLKYKGHLEMTLSGEFTRSLGINYATIVKIYCNDIDVSVMETDLIDTYFDSIQEAELKLSVYGWKMEETTLYVGGEYMGSEIVRAFILTR